MRKVRRIRSFGNLRPHNATRIGSGRLAILRSEPLGREHTCRPRRVTIEACGDVIAMLEVEVRCLKGQRKQSGTGVAAPSGFFFRLCNDPAAEPVATKILGEEKS